MSNGDSEIYSYFIIIYDVLESHFNPSGLLKI